MKNRRKNLYVKPELVELLRQIVDEAAQQIAKQPHLAKHVDAVSDLKAIESDLFFMSQKQKREKK